MAAGTYIAFEGLEGCGKSTHAKRLGARLGAVVTREPGGTAIGATLRAALADTANVHLSPRAEALMMAADRAQHLAELVGPALAAGRHVVSDRSVHSSLAYQGYGRGLDLAELHRINEWAIGGRWPDLVVLIDVPVDVLLARLERRERDRFEREDRAFFDRIAAGYAEMSRADPARWLVVDGAPPKDELEAIIAARVDAWMASR
ncbi:MAG: dTMP kinase [Ilumatobacteraceae bacterium]